MENRRDDEEVVLMVVGTAAEQAKAPPAKKRRLVKVADKGGASSSSFDPTRPFAKFAADLDAAQEAMAIEVAEPLKRKAPKTKVPFYYDNKTFAVSASRGFVKQLEKENWKSFMSFVKETAAPAVSVVESSAALEVVETGLGHPESQEAQGAVVLAQDPRPDVVVDVSIPQPESRPDVVERKSKKSSLGKVSSKFQIKSSTRRYVKRQKCKNNIYLLLFTI